MNRRNSLRLATDRTDNGSGIGRYRTPWGIVTILRSSDWVALLYFLYLAGVCWLRPLPASPRLYVTAISLATAGLVLASHGVSPVVRNWVPLVYIGVGYYLTGRFL